MALGSVSGFPGEQKFHFTDIPKGWLRVDVLDVLAPRVALMFPNDDAEQHRIEDAKGTNAIWDSQYMQLKRGH